MVQRGAVQSYEGHVNSHTQIQLGVDPYERYVMSGGCYFSDISISLTFLFENSDLVISGGEDCKLRIWSIKSGELLLEDKFSNSVLSTVCYQTFNSKHDMLLLFPLSMLHIFPFVVRSTLRVGFLVTYVRMCYFGAQSLKQKKKTNTHMTLLWVHGLDHMKDYSICTGYECKGS